MLSLFLLIAPFFQNPIVSRDGVGVEVPLATTTTAPMGVGAPGRTADHATLAMADNRDIAIVFHTSRAPFQGASLKQVELAYFQYLGNESWGHVGTELIGSIDHNPILGFLQPLVKCERPDVVAVGNQFFVVWTRRYDENFSGQQSNEQQFEPSVLECCWVGLDTTYNDVLVHNGGLAVGRGVILDAHSPLVGGRTFETRDCEGVADAVVLKDSGLSPSQVKVGVGYPHQEVFGSNNRSFDMRLVTSVFDTSTKSFSVPILNDVQTGIPFNGATSASGNSAGLILPDLEPAFEENSFWLTYEVQIVRVGPPNLPSGTIRLEYWTENASSVWALQASRSYKSSASNPPMVRRRPDISSRPTTANDEIVTLVFNETDPDPLGSDQSKNVVLTQVHYENGGFAPPTSPIPLWPNSPQKDDGKPVAIHGRNLLSGPHAFADRTDPPSSTCDIISDKLNTYGVNPFSSVGRPAVSHHYEAGHSSPDYFAVIFEKVENLGDPERIWITIE